ncbi:superoxide dismutase, Ni [Candidatus Daviesbacteria bacterium]|nr:superoxide dismutase, Ni [Candidatus Daviesbacteria bacterium]
MNLVNLLIKLLPAKPIFAHCDIPCGIYDPYPAQIAAHTVLRMTKLIKSLKVESDGIPLEERKKIIHDITRLTHIKEEHAEIVKKEIRIIWGDYFKEEALKDAPNLHEKVWKIMKLASKAKQGVDESVVMDLLLQVQEFAEIFWKSKGLEPIRIPSGYPTGGEIVSHK